MSGFIVLELPLRGFTDAAVPPASPAPPPPLAAAADPPRAQPPMRIGVRTRATAPRQLGG